MENLLFTLENPSIKSPILKLLEDNIILLRLHTRLDDLINVLQPNTEGIEPENNGIKPILNLLGFHSGDIYDDLFSYFWNVNCMRDDNRPFKEVAEIVLSGWKNIIKNPTTHGLND